MARNDIHCPSKIQPTEYDFVGIDTAPGSGLGYYGFVLAQRARIQAHMANTGGQWASHQHGGNCMSCGAHCIYTAVFLHRPTNEYIRTGMDCAEKIGIGDVNAFRVFTKAVDAARHHQAGKRKADGILQGLDLTNAWHLYLLVTELPRQLAEAGFDSQTPLPILADFAEENGSDNALVLRALAKEIKPTRQIDIAVDIVGKLVKYGSLSSRQVSYLRHLMDEVEGKPTEQPKPLPVPAPQPAPTGPRTFTVESRRGTRTVTSTLTDAECLAALAQVPNDSFAADLARQGASRGLSPRQWPWAFVIVEEHRQQETARRTEVAAAMNAAQAIVTEEGQMQGILDLFNAAKEHLQYPKIRLSVALDTGKEPTDDSPSPRTNRYRLYVAGERARHPGWIVVQTDARDRVGEISTDGLFLPHRGVDLNDHPGLVEKLRELAADPARIAAEYGREVGECCFCGLTLDDERSTAVGYGPVCAQHYKLPWGEAGKEMRCARVKREKAAAAVLGVN